MYAFKGEILKMKKRNLLFLLAAPALLVSCGGNSDEVIPTGETVSETEASAHFKKATESLVASDALGMKLELNATSNISIKSTSGGYEMTGSSKSEVGVTLKAGVKGLREEKLSDVKASVTGELSMTAESETKVGGSNASSTTTSDSLKGNAALYIDEGYIYLDAESLRPVLQIIASMTGGEFDKYAILKRKESLVDKESDTNPIPAFLEQIEWDEMLAQLKETFSKELETIKTKAGDYAYVFKADNSTLFGDASADSSSADISGETSFSVSFNDLGLTALGVRTNFVVDVSTDGYYTQKTEVEASAKASFFYGDNVTVEEVPNPSSFTTPTAASAE